MVWVNLRPWREQQLAKRRREWLLALFSLLLPGTVTLFLLYQPLSAAHQHWQQRINERQAALTQIEGLKEKLTQVQQQRHSLLTQKQRQQQQLWLNQEWHQFVLMLPKLMPTNLWLTRFQQENADFLISGICHEVEEINAFHQQLSQQPLLQQVSHALIEHHDNGTLQFTLHMSLRRDMKYE